MSCVEKEQVGAFGGGFAGGFAGSSIWDMVSSDIGVGVGVGTVRSMRLSDGGGLREIGRKADVIGCWDSRAGLLLELRDRLAGLLLGLLFGRWFCDCLAGLLPGLVMGWRFGD
jgi:hypothetical protein